MSIAWLHQGATLTVTVFVNVLPSLSFIEMASVISASLSLLGNLYQTWNWIVVACPTADTVDVLEDRISDS